jgi:predicted sulfurtransferase
VQVGGTRAEILEHIAQVKKHSVLGRGEEIDFKLSESAGALNEECRVESGFTKLAIRRCEELVSMNLGSRAALASGRYAATKLTPRQFHDTLTTAEPEDVVLIDTRNIYEWHIGNFQVVSHQLQMQAHACAQVPCSSPSQAS